MNKNENFHGVDFNVNAQAISDDELTAVSGGYNEFFHEWICPHCGKHFIFKDAMNDHIQDMHPQTQNS